MVFISVLCCHSASSLLEKSLSHTIAMPKRKHAAYTVQQKLQIVSRIRNGETQAKVSREAGIPESTLRGWLKEEPKLRQFLEEVDSDDGIKRKRTRTAKDPVLDKAVFNWFVQQRSEGLPISGPLVQAQAQGLSDSIHGEGAFHASRGWLHRWKKRHGIHQVKISGEIRSADLEAAEAFLPKFQALVEEEGYSPHQIYNADETALFYKMLPDHSLASKDDRSASHGHKQKKDRLTLLLATNWSGSHKVKPLVIGKSRSPRCFHHVNMSKLPLEYANSSNAWMTAALFEQWFHNSFVPSVRKSLRSQGLEERAILLLDNCPAHPPAESLRSTDGRIQVHYLPKNTTSKIQPMDQGVISTLKRSYRRELMRNILKEGSTLASFLKDLTVKDAMMILHQCWEGMSPASIRATWDKALGAREVEEEEEEEEEFLGFTEEEIQDASEALFRRLQQEEFPNFVADWAAVDEDEPTTGLQSAKELLEAAQSKEEEEEEETQAPPPTVISTSEAMEMSLKLQLYYESKGHMLKAMRAKSDAQDLKKELSRTQRQTKITDMFKKK